MTSHYLLRAKERARLSACSAAKLEQKVKIYGKISYELPVRERDYMNSKEANGLNCLYYQGFLFLLNEDGACVTLYKAPEWFGKKTCYNGKEKIRNAKRYARLNGGAILQ